MQCGGLCGLLRTRLNVLIQKRRNSKSGNRSARMCVRSAISFSRHWDSRDTRSKKMLQYTAESMVSVLTDYTFHMSRHETELWEKSNRERATQLRQAMEKLVASCGPALRQLRTLLR